MTLTSMFSQASTGWKYYIHRKFGRRKNTLSDCYRRGSLPSGHWIHLHQLSWADSKTSVGLWKKNPRTGSETVYELRASYHRRNRIFAYCQTRGQASLSTNPAKGRSAFYHPDNQCPLFQMGWNLFRLMPANSIMGSKNRKIDKTVKKAVLIYCLGIELSPLAREARGMGVKPFLLLNRKPAFKRRI